MLAKARLITKETKGKIQPDDNFILRTDFKSKLRRIKLNQNQMADTQLEVEKVQEGVLRERQYLIDAAIVRILKTRKALPHTQLVSELFSQLKFPCEVSFQLLS